MGLKFCADINDAPVTDLLRQANIVGKIVQTLEELQDHILFYIMVGQLTMAQMFQDQLLNTVQKVSTMQHALQE